MKTHGLTAKTIACVLVGAFGSSACAEVYLPKPSGAVVVAGNGSGYKIFKHGEDMGSEWAVRDAVNGDARAEAQADTASAERVGAIVTGVAASLAVGVGAGIGGYAWAQNNSSSQDLAYVGLGLACGGLLLYIISGALQGSSHTHMFNAVNMYNDDMAARGVEVRPLPVSGPLVESRPGVYITPGPGYAPQPAVVVPVTPQPASQ